MRRAGVVLLAVAAVGAWLANGQPIPSTASPPRPDIRPNVLIVLIDTLRQDHVGAFGYDQPTTPFIDSLAREGVVFERVYSQAPSTFNSTATMLTSRYFPIFGLNRDFDPLPGIAASPKSTMAATLLHDSNLTLAEVFGASGYETLALFTNPHHHPTSGFGQGFDRWKFLPRTDPKLSYATGEELNTAFADLIGELDEKSLPFFVYLHYMDVHNPYLAPEKYLREFVHSTGSDKYTNGVPEPDQVPTDEDLRFMMENYDAGIRHTDDLVREVVERARRKTGERPLVIVIAADHGDSFMENGELGHGTSMAVQQLRVPLILHGVPDGAGVRVRDVVRNLDIAPTLLAIAGISIPKAFEGESLLPSIQGDPELSRSGTSIDSYAWQHFLRNLVSGDWYATWDRNTDRYRLYDLAEDREGLRDVASENPTIMQQMATVLNALELRLDESKRLADLQVQNSGDAVDPAVLEQLEALGYTTID